MIKQVIKHWCRSSQDISGEYSTDCKIDFLLSQPLSFNILGKEYAVDRVILGYAPLSYDIWYTLGNADNSFEQLNIPNQLLLEVYKNLEREEDEGCLKDWCFSDDLTEYFEMDSISSNCFGCSEKLSDECSCKKYIFRE